MDAGGGGNHRSRSSTTPRRCCTCSPPPRTVVFDNHQESQAAQCLAQQMLRETKRNRSCLGKCRQFGAFLCPPWEAESDRRKAIAPIMSKLFPLAAVICRRVLLRCRSFSPSLDSRFVPARHDRQPVSALPTPVQLWSGVSVTFGGRARECHTGNELRISPM